MNGYYAKRFFGKGGILKGNKLSLDAGNPSSYPGTGTSWFDLSGSNNNGVLTNGVGFSGENMVFDGINDFVNFGNVLNLERTDSFSMVAVFKYSDFGQNGIIFSKALNSGTYRGYFANVNSTGNLQFGLRNTLTNSSQVRVNAPILLNTEYTVKYEYDGSSLASGIKICVNDVLQSLTIVSDTLTDTIINTANFNIGVREDVAVPFKGSIKSLNIFQY